MIRNAIEERRYAIRAPRILSISHRLHKRRGRTVDSPWYVSMTENMSVNGILFRSSAHYLIGDIIELEVVFSGVLDIFRGYGKVVRAEEKESTEPHSIAVTLVDLLVFSKLKT